jgi:hypothetical protein
MRNRRRSLTALLSVLGALAFCSAAQATPSVTFQKPSVQGDGNVLLNATVTSSPGDCGQQNAFGCLAALQLGAPNGQVVSDTTPLIWNDSDPSYQLQTVVPLAGHAAGTYNVFAALTNGSGTTKTFQGPSFAFPTTTLRLSAVSLQREGGALTLAYRVRDGGTLSGEKQQSQARTTLTLVRTGRARASAAKRFKVALHSQPGRNRVVLPYRVTRKVRHGEHYRLTLQIRDRLKRTHRVTARARL